MSSSGGDERARTQVGRSASSSVSQPLPARPYALYGYAHIGPWDYAPHSTLFQPCVHSVWPSDFFKIIHGVVL